MKIPPGMPAAQAAGIIEFLKANPAAAKAAWQQAQSIMQNRSLTDAFLNMQVRRGVRLLNVRVHAWGWAVLPQQQQLGRSSS